jgi:tRNA pseudouridine38-40 synthase
MNSNLPDDIHVIETKIVDDNFHARYNVTEKEYQYIINTGEYSPLERNLVFQYNYQLNLEAMADAIKVFVGRHDFRAFVTDNKEKENCVRTIFYASIEKNCDKIIITFRGDGFLRYQIRNMVGILIKVGENKISTNDVEKILESKDRTIGGKTAPASGLYLTNVKY